MVQGTSQTNKPTKAWTYRHEREVFTRDGGTGMTLESQIVAKTKRVKGGGCWRSRERREERTGTMGRECAGGTHCQGHSRRTRDHSVARRRDATRRDAADPLLLARRTSVRRESAPKSLVDLTPPVGASKAAPPIIVKRL